LQHGVATGELRQGISRPRSGRQPVPDPDRRTDARAPGRTVRDGMRGGGQLERHGASAERLFRPRPGRVVKRVMAATVTALFALVGDARAPASAGDVRTTPSPVAQSTAPASGAATPVYKPPTRGAPGGRMGGGTRGITGTAVISLLVPDHVGLTSQAQ